MAALAWLLLQAPIPLKNDVTRLKPCGGYVIAAGRDNVHAVDVRAWKLVRSVSMDVRLGQRFIGVAGGTVLTATRKGLIGYSADLSKQVWKSPLGDVALEAVETSGGAFVLVQKDHATQGGWILDPSSGKTTAAIDAGRDAQLWHASRGAVVFGSGKHVAIFNGSGRRTFRDALDGEQKLAAGAEAVVLGRGGKDGSTTVRGIDPSSGKELFRKKLRGGTGFAGTAAGLVFVFEHAGYSGTRLTALEYSGAKERWSAMLKVPPRRILAAGGTIVVETSRGSVGLNAADGTLLWRLRRMFPFTITRVGSDEFSPVVHLDAPCVIMADYTEGDDRPRVRLIEAASGRKRRDLAVPADLRAGLVVEDVWVLSGVRELRKVPLR